MFFETNFTGREEETRAGRINDQVVEAEVRCLKSQYCFISITVFKSENQSRMLKNKYIIIIHVYNNIVYNTL